MIYEVRTYTLRTGAVAEFEERFAKRKPLREKHSKLGAFWHTDFGPLNQVVHLAVRGSEAPHRRPRRDGEGQGSSAAARRTRSDRRAAGRHHDPGAVHAAPRQP